MDVSNLIPQGVYFNHFAPNFSCFGNFGVGFSLQTCWQWWIYFPVVVGCALMSLSPQNVYGHTCILTLSAATPTFRCTPWASSSWLSRDICQSFTSDGIRCSSAQVLFQAELLQMFSSANNRDGESVIRKIVFIDLCSSSV